MALEGSLRDMSLADLIRFLRVRAKSGVLLLSSGAEHGAIAVSAGQLISATLTHGAERRVIAADEEAVMRMLQWQEAAFMFQPDPSVAQHAATLAYDGEWLIEESARRRAQPLRALPPRPITLESQVQLAALPASAESGINLDLEQWRVLTQVAASHDVRAICAAAGLPPARTLAILADLAAIGLVDLLPAAGDAPEPAYDLLAALLRGLRGPGGS